MEKPSFRDAVYQSFFFWWAHYAAASGAFDNDLFDDYKADKGTPLVPLCRPLMRGVGPYLL